MNFGLPASKLVDTTAFEAKAPYNKYFVEALESAGPYPTNLNGSAFQTMFQKECESLWGGAITPEELLTRADEQAAEILNIYLAHRYDPEGRAAICRPFLERRAL